MNHELRHTPERDRVCRGSERQIIFSRASGVVSLGDILKYIDAKKQAGVLEYAELLDGENMSLIFQLQIYR
jgi:hypothetical protein